MLVATYNAGTLAMKGWNGYGYAECVLAKVRQRGCDFVPLQEKRAGKTEFSAARCEFSVLVRKKQKSGKTV